MKPSLALPVLLASIVTLACDDDTQGPTTTEATPADLDIDADSLGFGGVALGGVSPAVVLTISNRGGSRSNIPELTLEGDDAAAFTVERNLCRASVEPLRSCSLVLLFRPQHTGPSSAALLIDAERGGHFRVALAGEGLDPGVLVLDQRGRDLGAVVVGTTSADRVTFEVTNSGALPTGPLRLSGATPDLAVTDGCSGVPLAPASTCVIEVAFAPRTPGEVLATLVIRATPGGQVSGLVRGVGLELARLSATTDELDLGTTSVGATLTGEIVLSNAGGIATGPLSVTVSGVSPDAFTIEGCRGEPIAPGGTCALQVSFSPKTAGARSAQVRIAANPGGQVLAALDAAAVPTLLAIDADAESFEATALGDVSPAVRFQIENLSERDSGALEVRFAGADGDAFRSEHDQCDGVSLAPGARCTFEVVFAPLTRGTNTAEMLVQSPASGLVRVAFDGLALAPAALGVAPESIDFGGWAKGSITSSRDLVVDNLGDLPTSSIALAVIGADADAFRVQSHTCLSRLYPDASCVVRVVFAPSSIRDYAATLEITAETGGTSTVPLAGFGVDPEQLQVEPTAVTFAPVALGGFATAQVIVTNDSTAPTADIQVFKTGVASADFALSQSCGPLDPGEQCTISIGFKPREVGRREALLNIVANPGGTRLVPLVGDGTP